MKQLQTISQCLLVSAILASGCNQAPARYKVEESGRTKNQEPFKDKPRDERPVPAGIDTDGDGEIDMASPPAALTYTTAVPRITHLQWENSVKDVLLLSQVPGLSQNFTTDPAGSFFKSDGNLLKVTPSLWSDYQAAAETVAAKLVSDAAQMKKLIPPDLPQGTDARVKAIVEPIARRAFRRPLTEAQLNRLVSLYKAAPGLTGKTGDAAGLQMVITAILQSPRFVYRSELGSEKSDLVELDAYEIASRLSFAAWNTIPDETLLKAAASGELLQDQGLRTQVERLMHDPRADATLRTFYERIFETSTFVDAKKKKDVVGHWPDGIGTSLMQEAKLFIEDVVIKNEGGINQLLTAPYTFVDNKIAPIYEVDAPQGGEFVKVELNSDQRAGILTQAGFLARRSGETESDPIHRGVVLATNILCTPLEAPAGNFPPLPEAREGMTTRDRVEAHTGKGTCGSSCHGDVINPAGYAFENYDAIGRWRTEDNKLPVNAAAEYKFPSGKVSYKNAVDMMKAITSRDELHRCLVQKGVELVYARQVDKQDSSLVSVLAKKSASDVSTRELFIELLLDSRIKARGGEVE